MKHIYIYIHSTALKHINCCEKSILCCTSFYVLLVIFWKIFPHSILHFPTIQVIRLRWWRGILPTNVGCLATKQEGIYDGNITNQMCTSFNTKNLQAPLFGECVESLFSNFVWKWGAPKSKGLSAFSPSNLTQGSRWEYILSNYVYSNHQHIPIMVGFMLVFFPWICWINDIFLSQTPGLIFKSCNSEAWNSESWTWREGYGESSPPGKAGLGFNMFEHVKKLLKSTEKGKNIWNIERNMSETCLHCFLNLSIEIRWHSDRQ